MSATYRTDSVQGKCPACGWRGLFLGSGGYITCPQSDCKNPTLAADLLEMGGTLNDLVRAGAQVHHIDAIRDELRSIIGKEPFPDDFAAFLDRLIVGRNPKVGDQ